MNLAICSLSSGSSGNCYVIRSAKTALLVDAGISGKKIREGLALMGLSPDELSAVLITHEHSDHIKGLKVVANFTGADFFASRGTFGEIDEINEERRRPFESGAEFTIGDINIKSFPVSHDAADPVGYSFSSGGKQISIVTDTGYVSDAGLELIQSADILVLEANYDENILRVGPYPWFLKQRILGSQGHLSNELAAEALVKALKNEKLSGECKPRTVLLAHLSKENNFPEMAIATMRNILQEHDVMHRNLRLEALARLEISPIYYL